MDDVGAQPEGGADVHRGGGDERFGDRARVEENELVKTGGAHAFGDFVQQIVRRLRIDAEEAGGVSRQRETERR